MNINAKEVTSVIGYLVLQWGEAEATLDRVKALHARHALTLGAQSAVCSHCDHPYPCPTIQAIEERPQPPQS